MQVNLKFSHINNRFKERFGREFTQRDKREILKMVANKKAKISVNKAYPDKFCIYCVYEEKPMIFIIANHRTIIVIGRLIL